MRRRYGKRETKRGGGYYVLLRHVVGSEIVNVENIRPKCGRADKKGEHRFWRSISLLFGFGRMASIVVICESNERERTNGGERRGTVLNAVDAYRF